MSRQCSSCGGFCKKSGCERENVKPEPEPVAWMYVNEDGECEQIEYGEVFDDPSVTPLYTSPPKKEWVGLTDEEISGCINATAPLDKGQFLVEFSKSIEAKLKEKNS